MTSRCNAGQMDDTHQTKYIHFELLTQSFSTCSRTVKNRTFNCLVVRALTLQTPMIWVGRLLTETMLLFELKRETIQNVIDLSTHIRKHIMYFHQI